MSVSLFRSSLTNSSGGPISAMELPAGEVHLLFPALTSDDLAAGVTTYRKVFVKNTGETKMLNSPFVWLALPPTQGGEISIGLGSDNDADGSAVSYVSPRVFADALALPSLDPGEYQGLWIRRVIPAGTPEFIASAMQLAIRAVQS